jgi:hypothetical protein
MSIGNKWVVISPTGVRYEGDGPPDNQQISLRDYFAASALQGLLSDIPKSCYGLEWETNVVTSAYALADAMLTARTGIK